MTGEEARNMGRLIWLSLGWLAVGLGVLGIVLPGLPTTPFMLLAAFLFGKGSPRARAWLVEHAHFGPHIRAWEAERAVSPRAKRAAVVAMLAVFALSLLLGLPLWALALQGLAMGGAAAFILTRPEPGDG